MKTNNLEPKEAISSLAKLYLKNDNIFQQLAMYRSMRKVMAWGYSLNHLKIENEPQEVKEDYWKQANQYGLNRKEAIELSKALYYLSHEANAPETTR